MDRRILTEINEILRPLRNRIANTVARGVVHLSNEAKKLALLQVGALADELIEDAEHHQPYGFFSVPLAGAEVVLLFPNGDRSHAIALSASDRRYRPRNSDGGESGIYNHVGAIVRLTKDGDIIVRAAPGRDVIVDDGAGGTDALVKRSEFLGHGHATAATGPVSPPTAVAPGPDVGQFPGTAVLKAK